MILGRSQCFALRYWASFPMKISIKEELRLENVPRIMDARNESISSCRDGKWEREKTRKALKREDLNTMSMGQNFMSKDTPRDLDLLDKTMFRKYPMCVLENWVAADDSDFQPQQNRSRWHSNLRWQISLNVITRSGQVTTWCLDVAQQALRIRMWRTWQLHRFHEVVYRVRGVRASNHMTQVLRVSLVSLHQPISSNTVSLHTQHGRITFVRNTCGVRASTHMTQVLRGHSYHYTNQYRRTRYHYTLNMVE